MEYESFFKFLEGRPVKELNDCIHHIVDMVGTRFTKFQPKLESIQKAAIEAMTRVRSGYDESLESESIRAESVTKNIICTGIQMPQGMNGFNAKTKRFIRWLPGYNKPVSVKVGVENNLQSDWFLHKDLQVWLNWNPEGYFEMSRKDSLKFNESSPTNKHLLDMDHPKHGEKRKSGSDAHSGEQKKSKSSAPRFRYLSSSSEDEQEAKTPTATAQEAVTVHTPEQAQPSLATEVIPHADGIDFSTVEPIATGSANTPQQDEEERALELVRRNGLGNLVTPTAPPPRQPKPLPIKGDTVYITSGQYAGKKGTMMGQRGTDTEVFKIDIDMADGEHMIVTASIDEISLSSMAAAIQAEATPSPSPGAKVIKHRRRVEQPNPPQIEDTDASLTAAATTTADAPEPAESSKMEVDEESIDEFFEKLQSDHEDADEPYFKHNDTGASSPQATQHPAPAIVEKPAAAPSADEVQAAEADADTREESNDNALSTGEAVATAETEHDAPVIPPELREAYENAMRGTAAIVEHAVNEAFGSSAPSPSPCTDPSAAAVAPESDVSAAVQSPPNEPVIAVVEAVNTIDVVPTQRTQESPTAAEASSTETLMSLASEEVGAAADQSAGTVAATETPVAAVVSEFLVVPDQIQGEVNPSEPLQQDPAPAHVPSAAAPTVAATTHADAGTPVAEPAPPLAKEAVSEQAAAGPADTVAHSQSAPPTSSHSTDKAAKAEKKKKKKKHSTQKTTLQAGTQVRLKVGEFKGLVAEVIQEATGPEGMPAMQGVYKLRVMNDRSSITVLPDEFLQVIDPQAAGQEERGAPTDAPLQPPASAGSAAPPADHSTVTAAEGNLVELGARVTDEEVAEASIWN